MEAYKPLQNAELSPVLSLRPTSETTPVSLVNGESGNTNALGKDTAMTFAMGQIETNSPSSPRSSLNGAPISTPRIERANSFKYRTSDSSSKNNSPSGKGPTITPGTLGGGGGMGMGLQSSSIDPMDPRFSVTAGYERIETKQKSATPTLTRPASPTLNSRPRLRAPRGQSRANHPHNISVGAGLGPGGKSDLLHMPPTALSPVVAGASSSSVAVGGASVPVTSTPIQSGGRGSGIHSSSSSRASTSTVGSAVRSTRASAARAQHTSASASASAKRASTPTSIPRRVSSSSSSAAAAERGRSGSIGSAAGTPTATRSSSRNRSRSSGRGGGGAGGAQVGGTPKVAMLAPAAAEALAAAIMQEFGTDKPLHRWNSSTRVAYPTANEYAGQAIKNRKIDSPAAPKVNPLLRKKQQQQIAQEQQQQQQQQQGGTIAATSPYQAFGSTVDRTNQLETAAQYRSTSAGLGGNPGTGEGRRARASSSTTPIVRKLSKRRSVVEKLIDDMQRSPAGYGAASMGTGGGGSGDDMRRSYDNNNLPAFDRRKSDVLSTIDMEVLNYLASDVSIFAGGRGDDGGDSQATTDQFHHLAALTAEWLDATTNGGYDEDIDNTWGELAAPLREEDEDDDEEEEEDVAAGKEENGAEGGGGGDEKRPQGGSTAAAAAGSVERFYQYWLQDARQPRAEHHHRHLWRRGRREWQRGQVLARQAVFSGPEKVDFPYRSPATLRAAADQCGNQSRQDRGREGAEGDDCFAESARERREGGAAACRGLTGDPGQAARCGGAALGILAADPRARHQRVRQGERGAALEQHPQCRGHRAAAGGSGGQNPGRECTQARATIRH
mmetsp:Transcript_9868/g.16542  ORF Transcript_9868/g.16542 Transcript_9868/m.16542 type:complete len:839 (+) Transcript_9868:172-2688(+)